MERFPVIPEPTHQRVKIRIMRRHQGFSILELSIVISIFAVLSAMAFPYWDQILNAYRLDTATGIMTQNLRLARFEAVKNNHDVRVRFLSPTRFILEENPGGGWQAVRPAVEFSDRYWSQGVTVTGGSDPPLFYPSGRAESQVTLHLSNGYLETRQIVIYLTGMVRQS